MINSSSIGKPNLTVRETKGGPVDIVIPTVMYMLAKLPLNKVYWVYAKNVETGVLKTKLAFQKQCSELGSH